jgi:hypothetical protein
VPEQVLGPAVYDEVAPEEPYARARTSSRFLALELLAVVGLRHVWRSDRRAPVPRPRRSWTLERPNERKSP